jgi:hypothetical protein
LVKSSAKAKSNDKIKEEKVKRETTEGNLDKKGKPLKYRSDTDSDWTIRKEEPFYGMKEHAAIDLPRVIKKQNVLHGVNRVD